MPNNQSHDPRTSNPANRVAQAVQLAVAAVSGGSPALSGENAQVSYSLSGTSTGDTLTLSAKSGTAFGSVGPEFVMLLDSSQINASGNAVPRLGPTSSDENGVEIAELEADANMPTGGGYQMGTSSSEFGATTPPFSVTTGDGRLRVTCPQHFKSFESKVTYLPSARRQPVVDALVADYDVNGARGENDWGFKNLWNASGSGEFGSTAVGAAFFLGDLYDWYSPGAYWKDDPVVFSNVPSFPTFEFDGIILNAPDNSQSVNNDYWRDEPHQTEFYYDLGSLDTSVSDSVTWLSVYTPTTIVGAEEKTGQFMKNANDAETVPMAYFTYPGFVRGFNIPDGLNILENLHYKAVGDGAYCRVAITNNADYFQATKRTILEVSTPADWTDTEITARLHGGWFDLSNLTGLYINVVGIDNTQIASVEIA